jgi:hypothetical protein
MLQMLASGRASITASAPASDRTSDARSATPGSHKRARRYDIRWNDSSDMVVVVPRTCYFDRTFAASTGELRFQHRPG